MQPIDLGIKRIERTDVRVPILQRDYDAIEGGQDIVARQERK